MTDKWVTISDLHLNREGGTQFDTDAFVEKYEEEDIEGIAYLGDAVSRPDLHDDLENGDREWAEYFDTYHEFFDNLNEVSEELGVETYIGNGNHDPDPSAHPTRDGIRQMQDVHEDVARADFATELEPDEEGGENGDVEDPYEHLDEKFEDFNYSREDSVEDIFKLEHLREGNEREDTTIRGYLLDQFDNLTDAELSVVQGEEHDIVFGTSFLGPEYDGDEEQTGGLYDEEEFEELAKMLHEEPFYESWKRKGGLFGMVGDTAGSVANTVNTGVNYLSNAREVLFGEYDPEENDGDSDETTEEDFELPEDFKFENIPYEEASADHKRYINKLAAIDSLVEQVERPAIVMDHGMPNMTDVENGDLDLVDGEHKGSMIWKDQLGENADTLRSFVGGHFHNKGKREFIFDEDEEETQHVVNPAGTYAELGFEDGRVDEYTWFRPDGAVATNVLKEPTEADDIFEVIGLSEDEMRGLQRSPQVPNNLTDSVKSLLRAGDEENARDLVSSYASDL